MKKNVFIAGMPAAGKTTFLASMFHVLDDKRKTEKSYYIKLPDDTSYIHPLRKTWSLGEDFGRTLTLVPTDLSFSVYKDGNHLLDLNVPDMSGEVFKSLLTEREMEKVLAENISDANDILLFVHPQYIKDPIRLDNLRDSAKKLKASENSTAANSSSESTQTSSPEPKEDNLVVVDKFKYLDSPTQVLLVDLIQIFRKQNSHAKIGIIISAWDLLTGMFDTPEQFLETKLSLLSQTLKMDPLSSVFGLSANGGDLTVPKEKERILNLEPVERISFYNSKEMTTGYDRLLDWLVNGK